jgi:phosphoribosylanthranilate isomerase
MTKVKICGLTRLEDARAAAAFGADALGFVHERLSPRFIGDEDPKWIGELDPFLPKVAVFGKVDRVPAQTYFDLVQGVDWEMYPLPAPKRIHVIRLLPGQTARDLTTQMVNASVWLIDAFHPEAFGGTGKTVDWGIAAEIVHRAERPVILAGGLTPENVQEAVRRIRPYAVDVSSGVETSPGIKSLDRLQAFIENAKSA